MCSYLETLNTGALLWQFFRNVFFVRIKETPGKC